MREVSPVRATKRLSQEIPKGNDRLEGFYNKEKLYQNMIKNRKLLKRRKKRRRRNSIKILGRSNTCMHSKREREGEGERELATLHRKHIQQRKIKE